MAQENKNQEESSKQWYKKWWVWLIVIILVIGILADNPEDQPEPEQNNEEEMEETIDDEKEERQEIIEFEILREWNPFDNPEALGLDILIDEEDATKENIIDLVEKKGSEVNTANIKIYQSEQAWEEEKSGNYTTAYDKGYLADYTKVSDANEIRWFQAEGQLEDLMGTTTEIDN